MRKPRRESDVLNWDFGHFHLIHYWYVICSTLEQSFSILENMLFCFAFALNTELVSGCG